MFRFPAKCNSSSLAVKVQASEGRSHECSLFDERAHCLNKRETLEVVVAASPPTHTLAEPIPTVK